MNDLFTEARIEAGLVLGAVMFAISRGFAWLYAKHHKVAGDASPSPARGDRQAEAPPQSPAVTPISDAQSWNDWQASVTRARNELRSRDAHPAKRRGLADLRGYDPRDAA